MKHIMARSGRSLTSFVSSKISESEPKWFWLFFLCGGGAEINKKKHKQIGKIIAVGENSAFCMCKKIKKRKNI